MSEEIQALQTESPTVAEPTAQPAAPSMTDALFASVREDAAPQDQSVDTSTPAGSEGESALDSAAATDSTTKKHEQFIPYERFEEVNTKAKSLETRMAEIEVERQASAAWNPVLEAVRELGYSDPAAFVAQVAAQRQEAETAKIEGELNAYRDFVIGQYGEEVGNQLAEAKKLNVLADLKMAQMQEQSQKALQQIQISQLQAEQTKMIDAALTKAPAATHAAFRTLLTDVHPSYMAKATEQLNALIEAAQNDARAQYASGKQADAAATSPVSLGNGGQARSVAGSNFAESVQAIKSTGGFWDLVAKHGRT
jgi:hypothetical protein